VRRDTKKIVAFAEAKARTCGVNNFQNYMISMKKIQHMNSMSCWERPIYLVVGWADDVRYWRYNRHTSLEDLDLRFTGRTVQTRDPEDVEPCVYIPINEFKDVMSLAGE
jgi:hypothetical protein